MTDLLTAAEVVEAAADAFLDATGPYPVDDLDWQTTVQIIDTLRTTTKTLATVDVLLVRHAYKNRPGRYASIDGIGPVETVRSGGGWKHWDERGIAQAVIDHHMQDRQGEMPTDPFEVASWLLEVFGVQYCRTTALKTLGIPVDEFAEWENGKPTVKLPSRRR